MKKKLHKLDEFTEDGLSDELEGYSAEDINRSLQENQSDKKHVLLFIILGLAIVAFSFWYLYGNIAGPVAYERPDWLEEQLQEQGDAQVTIAELQERDTDQDGLTDYQEMYQYYTSIFIDDTDSDGVSDFDEVSSGADPLCPEGEDCSLLALITPKTRLVEVIEDVKLDEDLTLQGAIATDFRRILIESGMPQEEVNKLSDEDLLMLFKIVSENMAASEQSEEVSSEEVRNFLLAQPGADKERINQMTDQELISIGFQLLGISEEDNQSTEE
jgi:hypothetical protein